MVANNRNELHRQVEILFDKMDCDDDKKVDMGEFMLHAKRALDRGVELKKVLAEFVTQNTTSKDNKITLDEMKKYWDYVAEQLKSIDTAILCVKDEIGGAESKQLEKKKQLHASVEQLFRKMDKNGSGRIEIKEFGEHALGSGLSLKTLLETFQTQNTSLKDGLITLDEMKSYWDMVAKEIGSVATAINLVQAEMKDKGITAVVGTTKGSSSASGNNNTTQRTTTTTTTTVTTSTSAGGSSVPGGSNVATGGSSWSATRNSSNTAGGTSNSRSMLESHISSTGQTAGDLFQDADNSSRFQRKEEQYLVEQYRA
eukprot:UN06595